jgi:hypothetical protein
MADPVADSQTQDSAPPADEQPNPQAVVDQMIRELLAGLEPEQAAYMAAVLAARSSAEMHRIAKVQATAAKGGPDWGTWAALQNGARRLVLDAAPARESAARLAGRPR